MRKKFRRTRPRRNEKEGKDGGETEEPVGTRILAKDIDKAQGEPKIKNVYFQKEMVQKSRKTKGKIQGNKR